MAMAYAWKVVINVILARRRKKHTKQQCRTYRRSCSCFSACGCLPQEETVLCYCKL